MIYFLYQILYLCGFIFIGNTSLYCFYYYLLKCCNKEFNKLKHAQKFYVIKNLTKSTFLFILSIICTPVLYDIYKTGVWDTNIITMFGHIYVSTDVAGLLFVPELPFSTQIHHTIVFFCGIANILVDYSQPGIHRALIGLTYLSILPYLVNTLLGFRYLGFPILKRRLAIACTIIYGLSIIINCLAQHIYVFFYSEDSWLVRIIYLALYHVIFWDDRKLMIYIYKVAMNPTIKHDI